MRWQGLNVREKWQGLDSGLDQGNIKTTSSHTHPHTTHATLYLLGYGSDVSTVKEELPNSAVWGDVLGKDWGREDVGSGEGVTKHTRIPFFFISGLTASLMVWSCTGSRPSLCACMC